MTPERVRAIAEAAWVHPYRVEIDVAIERAITQAVNEALDKAANMAIFLTIEYPADLTDVGYNEACEDIERTIRALKLPEEP